VDRPAPPANADLERRIDRLYQRPLSEFTAERNALAKSLAGADAQRIKHLTKPALVPWIVNQVYWHARPVYQRLLTTGAALRQAQIAAIERPRAAGRHLETERQRLRHAADLHQRALEDAVQHGLQLAADATAHPPADLVRGMLEAISFAVEHPERPGRLTAVLQPTGFGLFAGITPASPPPSIEEAPARATSPERATSSPDPTATRDGRSSLKERTSVEPDSRLAAKRDAERKEQRRRARQAVDTARLTEARAREELARAEAAERQGQAALFRLVARTGTARATLEEAVRARETAERSLAGLE